MSTNQKRQTNKQKNKSRDVSLLVLQKRKVKGLLMLLGPRSDFDGIETKNTLLLQ